MAITLNLISGFLGAGKTTALRDQLARRKGREKVAVLVNDFGEAEIDRELLATGGFAMTEIQGACVCCTAPAGFVDALGALIEQGPDRIFIEPTGLAQPRDLIDTIRRCKHADALQLGPVVVLVDPAVASDANALLKQQAEAADILVASRADLATDAQLDAFFAWSKTLWPGPVQKIECRNGSLPLDIFEPLPPVPHDRFVAVPPAPDATGAATTHEHVARSVAWSADTVFSRDRLTEALAKAVTGRAGAPVARLKGLFRTPEGVFLLEVAGNRVHERLSSYRRDSRVDLIVAAEHRDTLQTVVDWLEGAVMSATELAVDATRLEVVLPSGARHQLDRDDLLALPGGFDDVSELVPKRSGAAASMAALLDRVEWPGGGEAVVVAADGYATPPVPADALRAGLILHSLGDGPLPDDKGGPFRLLIPGDAGPAGACSNVKGMVQLVLRPASSTPTA